MTLEQRAAAIFHDDRAGLSPEGNFHLGDSMKKLLFLAALFFTLAPLGLAQERTNIVVEDCDSLSLRPGVAAYTYVDKQGRLCVAVPAVTSSSDATAANQALEISGLSTIAANTTAENQKLVTISTNTGTTATNTAPLVTSGAGGYVRQDSTSTIAKETGGNLATTAAGIGATNIAYNCATDTTVVTLVQGVKCTNHLLQTPTGQQTLVNSNSVGLASDQAVLAAPLFVTLVPNATGGWSSVNATAADGATACTNSAQAIKASGGTFGGMLMLNNPNTADSWVQVYNSAFGSVTVGTTNPQLTFRIPGNSSFAAAANSVATNFLIPQGVNFSTAMSFACTSTAGGNGAPSNALELNVLYK